MRIHEQGRLPEWMDRYFEELQEIDAAGLPHMSRVKELMVEFLLRRHVNIPKDEEPPENKQQLMRRLRKYQEHFADAFHYAWQRVEGREDPVSAAVAGAPVDTWDFTIEGLEGLTEQEILPTNVRAAGALFYIYYLGERLGIFKLADVLVLNWAAGQIDIVEGEGVAKLYRYWKLREDRLTPEERGTVYRRVLDLGERQVLSRMAVKEHFPVL